MSEFVDKTAAEKVARKAILILDLQHEIISLAQAEMGQRPNPEQHRRDIERILAELRALDEYAG